MSEDSGLSNFKHDVYDIMSVAHRATQSRKSVGEKTGSLVLDIRPNVKYPFLSPRNNINFENL